MNYLIKNKHFIFIFLLFITLLLIVALIIYPTIKNILLINKQIMDERLELESKLAMGLNIKKTSESLEKIKQNMGQLELILVEPGQELSLIQKIEGEAAKNNLEIKIQSDFQKQSLNKNIDQVSLSLEITGSFVDTMKFIEAMEDMPYYYNIENIAMVGSENTTDIKTQLVGWIYFKKY